MKFNSLGLGTLLAFMQFHSSSVSAEPVNPTAHVNSSPTASPAASLSANQSANPSVNLSADPSVDPAANSVAKETSTSARSAVENAPDLAEYCKSSLSAFRGFSKEDYLTKACAQALVFDECKSVDGKPIFHLNRKGEDKKAANVLVFSLIHGDETHAGSAGRFWIERIQKFGPRNNWRIIPILNPDGVKLHTRTNANKIDINRNFPTKDWDQLAISHWKSTTNSNPRRFPGNAGGSEPETKCALKQIEDFKPNFVVSIHTPLKVLDFDGPKVKTPKYTYLPWKALGHYPGSLGRFLWFERKIPTLTMELKEDLPTSATAFEQLQDIIGTLVLLEEHKIH